MEFNCHFPIRLTAWRLTTHTHKFTFSIILCLQTVRRFSDHLMTIYQRNSIHEEIKSRLKSGNACYHSVQNLLSSRLLSKNTKIRVQRPVVLSVVLYGCETWSLTLREEQRLRVFENRVLRRIFGPKRDEATGSGDDYITRNLMTCTHHQILFG
jgi:hypothetical protein